MLHFLPGFRLSAKSSKFFRLGPVILPAFATWDLGTVAKSLDSRGEGGSSAAGEVPGLDLPVVLVECRSLSFDPGGLNQMLWDGARNLHFINFLLVT